MANNMDGAKVIRLVTDNRTATLGFTDSLFSIKRENKDSLELPLRQVLWARYDQNNLVVHFMARRKKRSALSLVKLAGQVHGDDRTGAPEWTEAFIEKTYSGIKRNRRLKVLVNPLGGKGKAVAIFKKKVEPVFAAARCSVDVTYTSHRKHAHALAKELPLDYDVLVAVSGDGLVHEIINGFAEHAEPLKAFNTPIAPIPTGSGNGLSHNLLGRDDGSDVSAAALNVVKGQPMKTDVFSLTQDGNRTFSFMSQALGLMADLDLGTEHLRWMGDSRFAAGLIRGLIKMKPCPITLSIKVAEQDKSKMVDRFLSAQAGNELNLPEPEGRSDSLPALKYSADDSEGWITVNKPLLFVYAGQGPYVARDLMQFPVSLPNDGLIDVVAQELITRCEVIKSMDGAETGQPFWLESQHYYKAHAYRVKPHSSKGCLSVDGEAYPFKEFQVEVHPKLASLLSSHGSYVAEFSQRKA